MRAKAGKPQGPHKPSPRGQGEAAAHRLVGALCPRGCPYILPKNPKKIRRSSKVLFRRRKLLSSQDPIWARSGALSEGDSDTEGLFINTMTSLMMRE